MKIYRLRELREERAMTQQELADRSQLHRNTVQRIETGEIGARPPVVKRLARALKIKPAELIHDPAGSETSSSPGTPASPPA